MKKNLKNTNKRKKWILVGIVTIIILIIIRLIIIHRDNKILKLREIEGQEDLINETIQKAYINSLEENSGAFSEDILKDELDEKFGENGYKLSEDLTKITINNKEYEIGITKLNETEEKIVKDKNGIVISKISGETEPWLPTLTSEITNNDLKTGLTIRDDNKNEWVWIEVPMSVTSNTRTDIEIETALRKYADTVVIRTEEFSDTYREGKGLSEKEYIEKKGKMLQSIKKNGGFYIGKYETGNAGGTLNKTYYDVNENIVENPENGYDCYSAVWNGGEAVITQNAQPYNWVTNKEAEDLAENFSTGTKDTSLLFGLQWDLTLKYLKEKGKVSEEELNSDSTSWGNYDKNGLIKTGSNAKFAKNNIYDFAGNLSEITLENTSADTEVSVMRGGNINDENNKNVIRRDYYMTEYAFGENIGFRATMY